MWTNVELAEQLTKAAGGVPPMDMRPRLHSLRTSPERVVMIRYEWIKDWVYMDWIITTSGWELGDGEEWFCMFMVND